MHAGAGSAAGRGDKPDQEGGGMCRAQVTWQWRSFTNPARTDGLELQHWVKCHKELATGTVKPVDGGEYQFAKYNKKARPPGVRRGFRD